MLYSFLQTLSHTFNKFLNSCINQMYKIYYHGQHVLDKKCKLYSFLQTLSHTFNKFLNSCINQMYKIYYHGQQMYFDL